MSLHWLPVKYRVQFKVCLMTYKAYKNKYPAYLEGCVQPYRSIYNTRHSEPTRHMLTVPHYDYKRHKCFKHLSNSYFYSAPRVWNSLSETCHVLLRWVHFVLIWRHISGQSHIRHSFYLPIILHGSWPIFRQWTMALIILMICASRMRFGAD